MRGRRWDSTSWRRLPQTSAAVAYAERKHAGQHRSDRTPFIRHPFEVAIPLYYAGAPDHVIAAGVLHDVIEKAAVSASELETRLGPGSRAGARGQR
jgi:(p)ppGpp synthase/HD superfamily hydrolase